ncbi:MAG: hypothetical protein Ct9H90mP10_07040 [Actinomycetota bacterium]|nr:MAG: hypothetical protein Ct9H90mP10_07040 [Actinomycetota bacterium]
MPFSPWTNQNDLIDIIKLMKIINLEKRGPIQLTIKIFDS